MPRPACCLLPAACCLLPAACCLLPAACCLLDPAYSHLPPAPCPLQVPQYILDEAIAAGVGATCSIICTQPRRIAAISVAARVAAERGEPEPGTGGRGQQQHGVVGYHVRLDAAVTSHTRMLFCTTGEGGGSWRSRC